MSSVNCEGVVYDVEILVMEVLRLWPGQSVSSAMLDEIARLEVASAMADLYLRAHFFGQNVGYEMLFF